MNLRYVRGRAFNMALLAIGYALQGEIDEACAHGRDAVGLAASLDSARAVTYIRHLLHQLASSKDEVQVREFSSYAQAALPALRQHASPR